ncbi:uncharacterized protein PHACADRAFT_257726 [Phanerochaete carnosa HHB-10118-sp]|uniref:Uncharacterized protein n=1 Tax=Phanerochaete carnosa (strain HHB-10118-sp) TaxID=650164 RepID=K5W745_PHACS|nr:uncharacterized protein PHACADRAFT_255239 [Phanerochaete carnosa HHB-10118-sp]XP_007396814.1 uncharacterized protein PHACADRAFT_257726 [Phanerochaete carnosa HHB-10118-sp]EKM54113.1 hypothetical protein PHACADRAFT_257726 [Phanerochaete carnosa HHB-10118-sp]EKM54980.1 hypothetical protein PHACADRAFT_255239 [Phanerochaete carnosa HHB-10118-sp]
MRVTCTREDISRIPKHKNGPYKPRELTLTRSPLQDGPGRVVGWGAAIQVGTAY